jgi:hypothetical protein
VSRRTPLYDLHRAAGARFTEFSGWEMPVQYGGIIAEHNAVRGSAGLFDVSHMGEIEVRGPGALALCQMVATNDASRLEVGRAQYTLWCTEDGGTIDDTILYPTGPRGTLVYLKASMTGHEDTAVLQYKASHPTFPHESTGDQFYREDQFESYRALGNDVACRTFSAVSEGADADKTILERAAKLIEVWSPELVHVDRFTDQTERLMELWRRIGASAGFRDLDSGTNGPSEETPSGRALFYLCCEMIQLMENVYLDLSLDDTWDHPDNAGWRVMFTNWSHCPAIVETWSRASGIFGTRFQFFCNRRLKLPLPTPAASV